VRCIVQCVRNKISFSFILQLSYCQANLVLDGYKPKLFPLLAFHKGCDRVCLVFVFFDAQEFYDCFKCCVLGFMET
jgi:hypothetical protein